MAIVIEGISGSGKSTQAGRLSQRLGLPMQLGEFSRGPIGRLVRGVYSRRQERFLRFHEDSRFADQTYFLLLADVIAKAEEAARATTEIVLIDRLFDSWLCYALAAQDRVVLDESRLRDLHRACVEAYLPPGAVTVFLEVEVDIALRRLSGRDRFGAGRPERERLEAIARNFAALYSRSPVVRVQADREPDQVTTTILENLGLQPQE